ncbi:MULTISPECIES: glycosyltransferase family 2 protein [Bacillaceae]|uniref:glycosyltransferase family 2 protein n=1 Tax=Bacillaceae TaxID=186817 RepID=UPI0006607548|nr:MULTISPECIES: glycosyltransferase [Bacillaceae]MCF7623649.1 glycosyltransferase [Peribacillus frigoritolerans]PRA94486.1 family 2 glycosyl transferase [Peribacillus simplex]
MVSLSVIIPIYNVEAYLGDCLDSVVNSMRHSNDINNIEIILVNDGTNDQSGEIAKRYSEKYNFKYVEKTNGGLADARNFGLEFARYEYVAFIDSDDKVTENFFFEIFLALKDNPDLIIFDWYDYFEDEDKLQKVVKGMESQRYLWSVQPSAWNKVYRRSYFENIKFPKGKVYEDVGTIYKILSKVNEYTYLDRPLYIYRKGRQNSLLTTISPKINHIYDVLEDTYVYYANIINKDKIIKEGLCYQYIRLLMWSNMYRQLKLYRFKMWGFYKKMRYTRSLIYKKFPEWKKSDFIEQNSDFFIERFGQNYINLIDNIGKNFISTIYTLLIVIMKNVKRK